MAPEAGRHLLPCPPPGLHLRVTGQQSRPVQAPPGEGSHRRRPFGRHPLGHQGARQLLFGQGPELDPDAAAGDRHHVRRDELGQEQENG